jgi:cell division protein FtsL
VRISELVKKHLDIDYLSLNTFEFRDRLLHFEKKINDLNEENTELKQQINNLTNKN